MPGFPGSGTTFTAVKPLGRVETGGEGRLDAEPICLIDTVTSCIPALAPGFTFTEILVRPPGVRNPALVSSCRAFVIAIVLGLIAGPEPNAPAVPVTTTGISVVRVTVPSEFCFTEVVARGGRRLGEIGGSELAGPVWVIVNVRV